MLNILYVNQMPTLCLPESTRKGRVETTPSYTVIIAASEHNNPDPVLGSLAHRTANGTETFRTSFYSILVKIF